MESDELGIREVEGTSGQLEERVVAEDYCQGFMDRLSQKDMEILELRIDGFTYDEIAKMLGYKNHSGVVKRMRVITKEFVKYEEEQK